MNKKGEIDWENPLNWPYLIIYFFVLIILFSALYTAYIQFSCSDIIQQRDSCYSDRDYWKTQYNLMNETITNCTNLIQNQIDICDSRIQNATETCEGKNKSCLDFVIVNKYFFVIYNITFIFFITLSIHLFKIVFKIGLWEKWQKFITTYQKVLLIIKIIFWIILTMFLLFFIIVFFMLSPF